MVTEPVDSAPAPPPAPAASPAVGGAGAIFAVSWAIFALAGILLGAIFPDGVFRDRMLPAWACVTLAATEVTLAVIPAAAAAGIWALLDRWVRRLSVPWQRWAVRILRALLVGVVLFLVAGSWIQFALVGQFLDQVGVVFVLGNIAAFWHYATVMYPLLLAAVPLLAGAVAFCFAEVLPRFLTARPRAVRALSHLAFWGIVSGAFVALTGEIARQAAGGTVHDETIGVDRDFVDYYALRRDFRAGPVTYLLASLIEGVPAAGGPVMAPLPREVRRPLLPMKEYVKRSEASAPMRWNVLLLLVDSLRADQIRATGGSREIMPNVEALAREGLVFVDCLSPSSHTDYATPSFLSSHYPLRAPRHHRYPRRPSYPCVLLPDLLKALGYRTAIFSSQGEAWCGMIHYLHPSTLDRFIDATAFLRATPENPEDEAALAESRKNPDPHIDDRITVGEAMAWIDEAGDPGPFFAYLNLQGAHSPYLVPDWFAPRFATTRRDFKVEYGNWPRERAAAVRGFYDDSCAYVDSQIGRMIDRLKVRGLWDRTIVVVSGDHGEAFYEHGFAAHGGPLYDEVVRVPLIVRIPGLLPGVDDRPAMLLDVPPTVCHALGLPPHPAFQGADLLAPPAPGGRSRFLVTQTPVSRQVAVVRDGWKLIFDLQEERYILYNRVQDPGERRDVSAEQPAVLEDLKARLGVWFDAQVGYYRDRERQGREYPPLLIESSSP